MDKEQSHSCTPDWKRREWTDPVPDMPVADEVHVWRSASLSQSTHPDPYYLLLSDEEKRRAARYRFAADCRRFVQARGTLRKLLGSYLDADPSRLVFDCGPFGKPCLSSPCADLRFNIAHSHEMTLFAFSATGEIGVDIEYIQAGHDWRGVGRCCFPSRTMVEIERLPEDHAKTAFYAEWTRTEALLKAAGTGLTGLAGQTGPESGAGRHGFKTVRLNPGKDYAASLAMPETKARLVFFDIGKCLF